jgi:SAM-dependent methyltransferase
MTIINNSFRFIFVHVPKAAGTSLTEVLNPYTNYCDLEIGGTVFGEKIQPAYRKRFGLAKHSSADAIRSVVGRVVWSKYFSFAFVRNPFARCLSTYHFLREWEGMEAEDAVLAAKMKQFNSFEEYVLSDIWLESNGPDEIFLPQACWVRSPKNNELIVNFVGQIERINEDMAFVMEVIGCLKGTNAFHGIPKFNASTQSMPIEISDQAVIAKIVKKYKDDFDTFGYSRNPGATASLPVKKEGDDLDKFQIQAEIYEQFKCLGDWKTWTSQHQQEVFSVEHSEKLIEYISKHGVDDPHCAITYSPNQVVITGGNFRETIKAGSLISRHRAMLLELQRVAKNDMNQLVSRQCKVYAPEGVTDFALYLRGAYPKFIGSEFAQTDKERGELFPIPSQDLQALTFSDGVFDLVLSNDVFEHVPDLDQALREIVRVLNDTGVLIATFPFLFQCDKSIVKARLVGGEIEHLVEPEYHGNPMRADEGSLVFELPAWDVVERAKNAGFSDAYFSYISSAKYGVVGQGINGVFVFVAMKKKNG